jgi:hypothetical protein
MEAGAAKGLHAQEDYFARHGTPRTSTGPRRHTFIGFDEENLFRPSVTKTLGL